MRLKKSQKPIETNVGSASTSTAKSLETMEVVVVVVVVVVGAVFVAVVVVAAVVVGAAVDKIPPAHEQNQTKQQ